MKHIVFLFALLLAVPAAAQIASRDSLPRPALHLPVSKPPNAWRIGRQAAGFSLGFVSGVSKAFREVIINDYHSFRRKYPNANEQWWNPAVSWYNKYKYGDPTKGPKFPGSTTFGVVVTDAYHLLPEIERYSYGAGVVVVTIGERRKWWEYALGFASVQIGYWAGFNITYYKHFNK